MRRESFAKPITIRQQQKTVPQPAASTYNAQDQNRTRGSWRGSDTINRGDNQGSSSHVPAGGPSRTQAAKAEAKLHDICPICNRKIRHTPRDCPTFQRLSDSEKDPYFYGEKPVCKVCLGDAYPHVIGNRPNFRQDSRYSTRSRG